MWVSGHTWGGTGRGEPRWAQGQMEGAKRQRQREMECTGKITWLELALMSCGVRPERAGRHVGKMQASLQEGGESAYQWWGVSSESL